MKHPFRQALCSFFYRATGRAEVLDNVEKLEKLFRSSRTVIDSEARFRLASLLRHAAKTVPYYKEKLSPTEISDSNAETVLATLPVLTKDIIRKQSESLVSTSPGTRIRQNTSGGSTGEPVRLLQDREMGRESASGTFLFYRWAGHTLGEPHLLIWGVPLATFGEAISFQERRFRFFHNQTYLNCYRISTELLDSWVDCINRVQPSLIEGYVDAMRELAERVLDRNVQVHSPRGIICSAGVLTDHARDVITRAFRAPLLNRYGSREVGNVACSCAEARELHVHETWSHIEIVDDRGKPCSPGEEGHILVTLLTNHTMPLIRYRIEDRGAWAEGECVCGRNTRRLKYIAGRMNDFLVGENGVHVNGVALTTLLYSVEGIKQFQYRQSGNGQVVLAIVPLDTFSTTRLRETLEKPVQQLRGLLAGSMVQVEFEKEILPSKSGKYRYIINDFANGDRRS